MISENRRSVSPNKSPKAKTNRTAVNAVRTGDSANLLILFNHETMVLGQQQ